MSEMRGGKVAYPLTGDGDKDLGALKRMVEGNDKSQLWPRRGNQG